MEENKECKKLKFKSHSDGVFTGIYGLGIIGAAVYYVGQSEAFWVGVLGVIKAFFWPAIIVYQVFKNLNL